jgi:hypothetical protein
MKKYLAFIAAIVAVLGILVLSLGGRPAQVSAGGGTGPIANSVPVQGKLTDSHGNPVNGTVTLILNIYNTAASGTALCSSTKSVTVSNGLFNETIDNCPSATFSGLQLYLGITVLGDAEMSPRQPIYPVPYAFSLVPGAVINGTLYQNLMVYSYAAAGGYPAAIVGQMYTASDGVGVYGGNLNTAAGAAGIGVWGRSYSPAGTGVWGSAPNGGVAVKGALWELP